MKCKKCGINLFSRETMVDADDENQRIVRYNYCGGCRMYYSVAGEELFNPQASPVPVQVPQSQSLGVEP